MVNLYVVCSSLEEPQSLINRTRNIIEKILEEIPQLDLIGYYNQKNELENLVGEELDRFARPSIILNSSGGTEEIIDFIVERCKSQVLIVADLKKNSFASSLEAYAHLKDKYPVKLFFDENESLKISEIKKFTKVVSALNYINNCRFFIIGSPSDWLLTSREISSFGRFKTKLNRIEVDEVVSWVEQISNSETSEIIEGWKSSYSNISVEEKSLIDSAKVYFALKTLVNENKIDVLSVRCFDLLSHNYTACMALSMLNDEGITSGCEGDIPTTFTMMVAEKLSENPVWMANPSLINKENNTITFAHCSVPNKFLSDTKKAGLTTHMESGLSTAISGPLKHEAVTIMRFSEKFDKLSAVKGRIIKSDMKNENLCRTQAVIEIDGNVEDWVEQSLGNHHVIVYGNLLQELKYFCSFSDVKLLLI